MIKIGSYSATFIGTFTVKSIYYDRDCHMYLSNTKFPVHMYSYLQLNCIVIFRDWPEKEEYELAELPEPENLLLG